LGFRGQLTVDGGVKRLAADYEDLIGSQDRTGCANRMLEFLTFHSRAASVEANRR
jgi:hypothetical protein